MAEETPFGLSFGSYGDPRKYMNKGGSPGKKVEQFVAKIKNSPLANLAGIMLAGGGEPSSSPVPAPALGQGISAPAVPPVGLNPNASGVGIAPGSFQMPNLTLPQIGTAAPAQSVDADGDGQIDDFWGVKSTPQAGLQSPPVDVTNKTDFNPLAPDASNQLAVSGNDYQQIPGYGKTQKIAGQIMGIG
jgi:hypothetical protein